MRIEMMPLSLLLQMAHKKNPKEHDIESLIESFVRFDFKAPPSIDEVTQVMVAGHGRCEALERMRKTGMAPPDGIEERGTEWWVPVIRGLEFANELERDAYVIADNAHVIQGGWRFDSLRDLLGTLRDADVGFGGIGIDQTDLEALMSPVIGDPPDDEGREVPVQSHTRRLLDGMQESPVPETPKVVVTKPGDVWILGEHRLFCGDCRKDISKLMQGKVANIAVTSPPYASQREYDASSGFEPIPPDRYTEWFDGVQATIARHLAPDGSWFLNIKPHADEGERSLYVIDLVLAHKRQWGWLFVDEFCWRNTRNGVPGGWPNRFKNAWEPVYHFSRQRQIKMRPDAVSAPSDRAFDYSPNNTKSESGSGLLGKNSDGYRDGLARPSNVIEFAAETSQGDHTAPFPLALPGFFIAAFTDERDIVLEPFCGSGTTLIAAEQLQRACRAVEISPAYCDVIIERWEKLTGGKAKRE